ncbi:MAG: alpha/beta hydrolase [Candidatus Lokiarchaeota archaeon]
MDLKQEAEEKYIDSNEVKLHTLIFGSGKPVILLHGFPDFWYGWKDIILGLKEEFKLIVPDLRGYNLSDKPENQESYKIQYLIEDVRSICQTLQLEKVTLIGHDWGGMIAWIFAEQHPELLNKLIILNAPHPKI